MKKIYFLCTGNTCRSQMAEGYARALLPGWRVQSAGIAPGQLDSRAVQVMAEDGIDISKQFAKPIDPHVLKTADLVVTLCGDARDHCPVTPPTVQKLHWPLPDPAHATGTPDQQLAVFRQVRDQIKHNILDLKHVR